MIKMPKIITSLVIIIAGSVTLIITGGVDSIKQYMTTSNSLTVLNSTADTLSSENEMTRQKLISSNKLSTVDSLNDFLQENPNITVTKISAYTVVNGELELVAELDRLTDVSSLNNIDSVGVTFRWGGTFSELTDCLSSNKITFMEMKINSIKREIYLSIPI